MTYLGSMQGRLVPPYENRIQCFPMYNWELEFERAAQVGLNCIEWIYDGHGTDQNPIGFDEGLELIRQASSKYGIQVRSVCADIFMEEPLVRATEAELTVRMNLLVGLLRRCRKLGIQRVVIPFVDASRIDTELEMKGVVAVLHAVLRVAQDTGIEIHLETSLPPLRFADFMERVGHPLCKINYDSGNSAALGYSPVEEFKAYGVKVGSVHIKDRLLGGGTVPLGQGNTDFVSLWKCLKGVQYRGDFILQVARGESGREVDWAKKNLAFLQENLRTFEIGFDAIKP